VNSLKKLALALCAVLILSLAAACSDAGKNVNHEELVEMGLRKISVALGRVEAYIPESFEIMSEAMMKEKYPTDNRPTIVYTNKDGTVNVAFNHTDTNMKHGDIPKMLEEIKGAFSIVFPSAQWHRSEVEKVNGRNVGVLELVSPAVDTDIYNLMWFTDLDDRMMMATFNCTIEQLEDWKELAGHIMGSFVIVK
jgi:hypothetical protein